MIRRRALNVTSLKTLVIDEVDVMLERDFESQIRDIFGIIPNDVQVVLSSATFTPHALSMSEKFMRDPIRILIKVSYTLCIW